MPPCAAAGERIAGAACGCKRRRKNYDGRGTDLRGPVLLARDFAELAGEAVRAERRHAEAEDAVFGARRDFPDAAAGGIERMNHAIPRAGETELDVGRAGARKRPAAARNQDAPRLVGKFRALALHVREETPEPVPMSSCDIAGEHAVVADFQ